VEALKEKIDAMLGKRLYRFHKFNDMNCKKLLENISMMNDIYKAREDVDTVIVLYSGHGYYSKSSIFSGILTNDHVKVSFIDILKRLNGFKRLLAIFDGCSSHSSGNEPVIDQIKNPEFMAVLPSAKGCSTEGGIDSVFIDVLGSQKHPKYIGGFDMTKLSKSMLTVHSLMSSEKPRFYANSYMRVAYKREIEELLKLTGQEMYEAYITIVNNKAKVNRRAEELKKALELVQNRNTKNQNKINDTRSRINSLNRENDRIKAQMQENDRIINTLKENLIQFEFAQGRFKRQEQQLYIELDRMRR
jgi:hypothetical protein